MDNMLKTGKQQASDCPDHHTGPHALPARNANGHAALAAGLVVNSGQVEQDQYQRPNGVHKEVKGHAPAHFPSATQHQAESAACKEAVQELTMLWREMLLARRQLLHADPGTIGYFITDSNAVIRGINFTAAETLGHETDYFVGKPLLKYVNAPSRDILMLYLLGLFEGINALVELSFLGADGQEIPVILRSFPLQFAAADEQVYSASMVIFDYKKEALALDKDSQRLEAAFNHLHENYGQLVEDECRQGMERMARGIAHKFNNLLSPVLGFTEVLLAYPENLTDTDKATQYLKMIRTAALEAKDVIRRLGEFYHGRSSNDVCEPLQLNEVVEAAVATVQHRSSASAFRGDAPVRIERHLADNLPAVNGVKTELREALVNVLTNAMEAMPEGGTMTLTTRSAGDEVVIEVKDTGVGMTEETRRRCTEPFFSTKTGAGLGLSIVSGVVRRHTGRLEFESSPKQGTTCRIWLPVP